jgi:L-fucose mutarotase
LAVVDANFPADSVALRTGHGRVVPLAGVSMPEAVRAILTLLPLDDFVDTPVRRMASDNSAPDNLPEVQREVQVVIDKAAGRPWPTGIVERFDFYEAARNAYAVVRTGERRYYGNVLIRKGAIPPDA